jgi:hypothetical protein
VLVGVAALPAALAGVAVVPLLVVLVSITARERA